MQPKPRRVLGYCRVSTDEQQKTGTSLGAQQEEIERYCRGFDLPAPAIFVEVESGSGEKAERRFEQARLLADVRPGDLVIISKIDRWSRDTLFFLQSARDISARGGNLLSIAERFDLAAPEGKFAATLMAAVAEQERARIRERMIGNRQRLRNAGHWVEGQAPLGYRVVARQLIIDPETAPHIRKAFAMAAAGKSLIDIKTELDVDGCERDRQVWWKTLHKRVYLGEMSNTRGIYAPAHDALVDADLWQRAQAGMAARRIGGSRPKGNARTANWLLRSIAICGACGSRIGARYGSVPDGYYTCNGRMRDRGCHEPPVRVATIDRVVSLFTRERLEQLRELLTQKPDDSASAEAANRLQRLLNHRASVQVKRARAVDLVVDGTITKAELKQRLVEIDGELGRVALHIADAERDAATLPPEARASALRDVTTLRRAWLRATPPERREALAVLAERIEVQGGQVRIVWKGEAALTNQLSPSFSGRLQMIESAKVRKKQPKRRDRTAKGTKK